MRSLCLDLTCSVVCHTEQSIVAVSDFSKPFVYSDSSFLAKQPFLMLSL